MFTLPGVSAISDFSNQLYVRGGNFDETVIRLDGVPLYNPYHLGGLFSSVNNDIVGKEKIYLSNYPMDNGGYLSGEVLLKSQNASSNILTTSASLGITSSKGYVQSPLGKGSFIFAARRTYFDILAKIVGESLPYYFYDMYFKYTIPFDDNNLFQASALYSKDVYKLFLDGEQIYDQVQNHPNWGNFILNSKFTHIFNKDNEINAQLYYSSSQMGAELAVDLVPKSKTLIKNKIQDITANIDYNFLINDNHFKFGFEAKNLNLTYDWNIGYNLELRSLINPPEDIFFDYAPNPYSYSAKTNLLSSYMLSNIPLLKAMESSFSLRGTYSSISKSFNFSPAINLKYDYSKNISLELNYGIYYQYLYTIKERRNESFYTPYSALFLASDKNKILSSQNYDLGINIINLPLKTELNIDLYYRNRKNLPASYNNEPRYRFENGYAAGLDLMITKKEGTLNGWAAYSFSRSIKFGNEYDYFSSYDRTHNIKILFNFNLSEKWKLSAFWTYASGLPYTKVIGKFEGGTDYKDAYDFNFYGQKYGGVWRPIETSKNAQRMEANHRLDIGLVGSFIWGSLLVKPYLQVLNIYNSPNAYFYTYDVEKSDEKIDYWGSFIVPTIGVTIDF